MKRAWRGVKFGSISAAAQLAGVPKPYFLSHLADYGVNTFDLSEEDLTHDLESA
ncbi:MAG: hypothetical protein DMG57_33165 [Acidobacteria bacterium]|nr:MAG: hypothetical protein DMG57_33165 [Acidobacteriota bacterium]